MPEPDNFAAGNREGYLISFVLGANLFFPLLFPALSWIYSFIPMIFGFYYTGHNRDRVNRLLIPALLLSGIFALFIGSFLNFMFAVAMIWGGVILANSFINSDGPSWTGIKLFGYFVALWLIVSVIAGLTGEPGPKETVNHNIDQLVQAMVEQSSDTNTSEARQQELYAALDSFKEFINRAWVGLFALSLLLLTWLNMLGCHSLIVARFGQGPWAEGLRAWRLPDAFVILFAASLLMLLLGGDGLLATLGLNVLLFAGVLYFLQGIGVMDCLMRRWNLPKLLRFFCYAIVLLQGYGLLLLALLGLAEVKLDLRKKYPAST